MKNQLYYIKIEYNVKCKMQTPKCLSFVLMLIKLSAQLQNALLLTK